MAFPENRKWQIVNRRIKSSGHRLTHAAKTAFVRPRFESSATIPTCRDKRVEGNRSQQPRGKEKHIVYYMSPPVVESIHLFFLQIITIKGNRTRSSKMQAFPCCCGEGGLEYQAH